MNIIDIVFAVVVAFFLIRGLFRGLITEVAAIGGVVGGFLVANAFYKDAVPYVAKVVPSADWVEIASYAAVFFGVVLITSLLAAGLRSLVDASPVAWLNRIGGGVLGGAKGVLICSVLLMGATYLMPDSDLVGRSVVVPYLKQVTNVLEEFLPDKTL